MPSNSTLDRRKQRLLLASGLVALLLAAHLALMARERHMPATTPLHERFAATLTMPLAVPLTMHGASQSPAPAPHHFANDCPGQAAVVPLLLLLLALVGMRTGAVGTPRRTAMNRLGFRSTLPALPPMAAHRRRALLQVYLN